MAWGRGGQYHQNKLHTSEEMCPDVDLATPFVVREWILNVTSKVHRGHQLTAC